MSDIPADDLMTLWDAYHPKITRYMSKRIYHEAVEDLVQDVFLQVWEALLDGKGHTESVSGWLYRIAHNALIDEYRKRDVRNTVDLDESTPDLAESLPDTVERAEVIAMLQAAAKGISPEQASIIKLRYEEELDVIEISNRLNKSYGATKALMYRAHVSLYERLQKGMGQEGPRPTISGNYLDEMIAVLRERGPMTARELTTAMLINRAIIDTMFSRYRDNFTLVRTAIVRGSRVQFWGVRGIHDAQEAA